MNSYDTDGEKKKGANRQKRHQKRREKEREE